MKDEMALFLLLSQLLFAREIVLKINLYKYIAILMINCSIDIPIVINCLSYINEIACTLTLQKLTNKVENNKSRNGA
jgi:hypothetical protein